MTVRLICHPKLSLGVTVDVYPVCLNVALVQTSDLLMVLRKLPNLHAAKPLNTSLEEKKNSFYCDVYLVNRFTEIGFTGSRNWEPERGESVKQELMNIFEECI